MCVARCCLNGSAINPALKRGRYMSRFGSPAELPRNSAAPARRPPEWRLIGRRIPPPSLPWRAAGMVPAVPRFPQSRAINGGGQLNTGTSRSWWYSYTAVAAAASSDLNVSRRAGLMMVSWPWQRPHALVFQVLMCKWVGLDQMCTVPRRDPALLQR